MKVAQGLYMLEISANIMGEVSVIHPALILDGNSVILVDTGYPGQLPNFREALEKAGVPFDKLNKVIITHQDIDHIGSLPAILDEALQTIEVLASKGEKPYIQGEKPLIKMNPVTIDQWPEELRKVVKPLLENPPKAAVDRTVTDGEELPYCGGITVIGTPGHSPDHISLYHKPSKTLITGDAMGVSDGQLVGPTPRATPDMKLAIHSLKKLTQYDIETIICYHGGLYKGDANRAIVQLADGR